jgi:hypothetical protein
MLALIYSIAVWNGANYYIEVFSKSYDKLYKEPVSDPSEACYAARDPSQPPPPAAVANDEHVQAIDAKVE